MTVRIRSLASVWWHWERPSLVRVVTPVWLVSGLIAAVIFGRNGMHPHEITEPIATVPVARLVLFVVWGLFTAPSFLAHAHASCREVLLSQPIASTRMTSVLWLSASVTHLPLALLCVAGSGMGLAVTLISNTLAIQSHVWVALRSNVGRAWSIALACGVLTIALVPVPAHPRSALDVVLITTSAGIATLIALWGLHRTWRFDRVSQRGTHAQTFSNHPVRALAKNHALGLTRMHAMALLRLALVALVGGALSALLVRNRNEVALRASWPVLSVMESIVLVMSASVLTFPLLDQERRQSAMFDSMHVRMSERLRASAWVLLLGNALAGATFWMGHALVAFLMHTTTRGTGWILMHAAGAGMGIAMLVEWWIRRSRDRDNAVMGLVAIAIVGAIVGGQLGVWWSPLLGVLGVLACFARSPLAEET